MIIMGLKDEKAAPREQVPGEQRAENINEPQLLARKMRSRNYFVQSDDIFFA